MKVTIFKNFTQVISNLDISEILQQIKNGNYKQQIINLQKLVNASKIEEYNKQKKSLPAFTPSGTFIDGRKMEFLKSYSGLIILDFDKLTENHLSLLSEKVLKNPFTFAFFKSPSGNGCKVLVKVSSTLENHLLAFNQVRLYYENTVALHVDPSGKDVTRLCFLSYDPDLYFNPEAKTFQVVEPTEQDDIENIISQIESHQIDITSTYDEWIKICFALIDALGAGARDYYHRVSKFNPDYSYEKCEAQFNHCLNSKGSGITIKTFFGFAKDHGIINSRKHQVSSHTERNHDVTAESKNQITAKQTSEKKMGCPVRRRRATNKFHLVRDYLDDHFDIRYNTISTEFEYKEKDQKVYKPMNENNIFIKMSLDGLCFSLNNLMAFLKSDLVPSYNPFTRFFDSLPQWSGDTDHIRELASFVKLMPDIRDRFDNHFKKWLVRAVKCAVVDNYFNKQAFILVHEKQNSGKSTFCRFLCPPQLSNYIAENLSIDKDSRILLTTNFLINLDELSTLSKFEINSLKSLFSKDKINDRLPYDRKNSIIPRRASFIGSTNQAEFLNDESGSVRWLCFVIESIDWSYKEKVNIDLIWAQAYHLFKKNYPCDLTPDEIKENEEYNRQFHITTSEFELIQKYLAPATKEEYEAFMTATDIVLHLSEKTSGRVKLSPINIGKALKMLSFPREKKYPEKIYGYYVLKKSNEI
ncbi:MAG: VapE domain-containing protein [Bacteroidota bacterium]